MKPQPEPAVAPRGSGGTAGRGQPAREVKRKRTFQMGAGSGKTMFLAYALAEKEELSSNLAALCAEHASLQKALATPPSDEATLWSTQEPPPALVFLSGSFNSSVVLKSLHEIDVVSFIGHGNVEGTNLSRFFTVDVDDDPLLTPRERAARAMLRRRLALAAFLTRLLRSRLKRINRSISLILRDRAAHDQRRSTFAREIPWFLQHGCHPPAEAALRFDGLFSSGNALIS